MVKKSIILTVLLLGVVSSVPSVSAEETATSTIEQVSAIPEQATTTPALVPETTSATSTEITATSTPVQTIVPTPVVTPQVISTVPEPAPQPASPSPVDSAIAPSKVTIKVIMLDGTPPSFPVYVTFVGVGNKNFGGKINANGELIVTMPSGRYYTDVLVISTEYVQGEDGPSFFLEANEQRDFGVLRLMPKSEMTSQSSADTSLEKDMLAQAESTTGVGKILFLIVKLLMQILEKVTVIAQKMG